MAVKTLMRPAAVAEGEVASDPDLGCGYADVGMIYMEAYGTFDASHNSHLKKLTEKGRINNCRAFHASATHQSAWPDSPEISGCVMVMPRLL
jgi:hypothetical protein